MWRDSPTFRRQCAHLADDVVTVVVRLVGPSAELRDNAARSRIEMQHGSLTLADVRLGIIEPRYLAHEIEYLVEQLDGVDLRAAAADRVNGVRGTRSGPFETARALSVEAQVAREVAMYSERHNDPQGTSSPSRGEGPRRR